MSYGETEEICDGKGKTLNDFNTSVVILIKCTVIDIFYDCLFTIYSRYVTEY